MKSAALPPAKGSPPIVVYADTTLDYGCLCPPFVLAPFWNTGRDDATIHPVFARGVPDAPPAKQGLFRFAGHFDGRRITGFDWLKLRHEKADGEGRSEYEKRGPVFVVEGWCFEPAASFADEGAEKIYREPLRRMAVEGRFCPGAKLPASPTRRILAESARHLAGRLTAVRPRLPA